MTMAAPFLTKEDVNQLKEYVMAPSGANKAESTVLLHISHSNLKMTKFFEIRLDRHVSYAARCHAAHARANPLTHSRISQMSIESVKVKLSFHCGTSPSAMVLQLLDESKNVVATMHEDDRMLGYYSPHDGWVPPRWPE